MTWTSPEQVAQLMVRPPARDDLTGWRQRYIRIAQVVDLGGLLVAGLVTIVVTERLPEGVGPGSGGEYLAITAGLVALWCLTQRASGVYDRMFVVEGAEEYRRVLRAEVVVFATASIVAAATAFSLSRAYLFIFFGLGTVVVFGGRKVHRSILIRMRIHRRGALSRVLVIGTARSSRALAEAFTARAQEGYRVAGVWWPDHAAHYGPLIWIQDDELPSFDGGHTLADAVVGTGADTVIVTDTELLGSVGLKELGWALEGTGIDLLVSPNLIDVAGPRVHVRPVANLPLIHLDEPRYLGATRIEKVLLDRVGALVGLLLASPLMLVIAAAIKLSDGGSVFYRAERLGVGGVPFRMVKFRTMVMGAEHLRAQLDADSDSVLFKMRADPRVTRVGRLLRRFSLDELPQLFNVLAGTMSIVGPRPPLPSEVLLWEGGVERRLLVKQGMTGLWQISGRSDLNWEDGVRLDLDYVENWSIVRDLQIIWRTVHAVLTSRGAY